MIFHKHFKEANLFGVSHIFNDKNSFFKIRQFSFLNKFFNIFKYLFEFPITPNFYKLFFILNLRIFTSEFWKSVIIEDYIINEKIQNV